MGDLGVKSLVESLQRNTCLTSLDLRHNQLGLVACRRAHTYTHTRARARNYACMHRTIAHDAMQLACFLDTYADYLVMDGPVLRCFVLCPVMPRRLLGTLLREHNTTLRTLHLATDSQHVDSEEDRPVFVVSQTCMHVKPRSTIAYSFWI